MKNYINKIYDNKVVLCLIITLWSFATMLALTIVSGFGITGIELVLPCLFALCIIVYSKTIQIVGNDITKARQDLRYTAPLGIVVSLTTVIGSNFDMLNGTVEAFGIVDFVFVVILTPYFISLAILFLAALDYLTGFLKHHGVISCTRDDSLSFGKLPWKKIIVSMLIMLICWMPYYLTYYPGGLSADVYECINISQGNIPWTNHHPVAFTVMIKLFLLMFGEVNLAMGMLVLVQMIYMAFVLSLMLIWLEYHGAGKIWIRIGLAFMALFPVFPMYSILLIKDIPFACWIALIVMFVYELIGSSAWQDTKKNAVSVIIGLLSFLTIITRNNGTFVIIFLAIATILYFKKLRKHLLITFAIVFALNGLYKGPVWNAIGIEKQSFVESASVPLMQIAYTITTDGKIDEDDREYLESIMPFEDVKARLELGAVDTYKFDKAFNADVIDADTGKFIKVWFHMLPANFGKYVEAYLAEVSGYWHYGESNTLCVDGVRPNDVGIYGTDFIENATGFSLKGIFTQVMLVVRKLPILCMLTQMAVEILAVIILACQFARKNKKELIIALVPLFATWVSVMIAAPNYCLFRYMYAVFFLWPIILYEMVEDI